MIDLHCHLLPGVDDGAETIDDSVAMAQAALADGVEAIVATPHVNHHFDVDPHSINGRVEDLRREFEGRGVPLVVHAGAEVSASKLMDLDDDAVRACCIAGGPYLLVEPSFSNPMPFIGQLMFQLGLKGIRPLIVHPERSLALQRDDDLVEGLVNQGAGLILNAGSITGAFGDAPRKAAWRLLERGLVHAVASDAHSAGTRAPVLAEPLADQAIDRAALEFLTVTAPRAIVAGEPLPRDAPRLAPPKRRPVWRR